MKISIVTINLNMAAFLEQTIQSVLNQNYPDLEYIIIDGGSTDGSVEIIKKYSSRITKWVSEKDNGMYEAIQKGFKYATGDILAWLNAGDLYAPGALQKVADVFTAFPEVQWLTSGVHTDVNENASKFHENEVDGYEIRALQKGRYLPLGDWYATYFIQQEATFWRRELWEKNSQPIKYRLAGDFELWVRFSRKDELYSLSAPLGVFRVHSDQLSSAKNKYKQEAIQILKDYGFQRYNRIESIFWSRIYKYLPVVFDKLLFWLGIISYRKIIIENGDSYKLECYKGRIKL